MKLRYRKAIASAFAAASLLAGCGGGGGGDSPAMPTGTLRLALTDMPACGYDAVNVTIEKVRVHQSDGAGDSASGWSEVVLEPAKRVELLTLTNGVLEELGQTPLPTGKYTQMRLVLAANDATTPLANSVTPTGGTETALATPSAVQSGLKINIDIDVTADKVADFVLDFDACRSVVKAGGSGRYNLKPVVSVIPRLSDAANRIVGYVPLGLVAGTTGVSAQTDGVPVKSTTPDATGKFVLSPLPEGGYDVVISADGRRTASITGVPVTSTENTVLNSDATPIDPPAATMRTASGTVTITPTPSSIDAVVVVHKAYTGGPTVEVAGGPVDAVTGSFSYTLPAEAPVKAPYGAALTFAEDGASPAGVYTLVATSGTATKSADIDVTTADKTDVVIAFP
ncbi:MAG: hypothetical protein A3H32_13775 [Betaproteobacteria bacterium RIFCSPLOWO2_02_FULL_63_19]|nr:MAG: hypothetical protein A3H32_13775 [Betaproteobacteria bacterium RIFCSPLOWO2_02_FULL_63_19]